MFNSYTAKIKKLRRVIFVCISCFVYLFLMDSIKRLFVSDFDSEKVHI